MKNKLLLNWQGIFQHLACASIIVADTQQMDKIHQDMVTHAHIFFPIPTVGLPCTFIMIITQDEIKFASL